MSDNNINDEKSFEWISQMRYYHVDKKVSVDMINSSLEYGYEYLGNTDRLVMTQLTDRCFRFIF